MASATSQPIMQVFDRITAELERDPIGYGFEDGQEALDYAYWVRRTSIIGKDGADIKGIRTPKDLLRIYPIGDFRIEDMAQQADEKYKMDGLR